MLEVKTPEEVLRLIKKDFHPIGRSETVSLAEALGRMLAEDVSAEEYVPDFDRSTVDGYALHAKDTFGCSDAIPAVLNLAGEVKMGEGASVRVPRDACAYVPTGGAIPEGCDCVVMIEYTEDYGDGTIGILKPATTYSPARKCSAPAGCLPRRISVRSLPSAKRRSRSDRDCAWA